MGKMALASLMCVCTEWFYGKVPCVVLHGTRVIVRVIIDGVLNVCRRTKLRTVRNDPVITVDPLESYVKL